MAAVEPRVREEQASDAVEFTEELVGEVHAALSEGEDARAADRAATLHAADMADLLQMLERDERVRLVTAVGVRLESETLSYLAEEVREELVEDLGPEALGRVLVDLEVDDAVDILEDLDEAEQKAILARLPLPDRTAIERNLAFPEHSAGRLMQREVVAVPDYWEVGQTIDYLRAHPDLPDVFYDIFLVDPMFRPVGAVPLSNVLRSRRATPLKQLRVKGLRLIEANTDQERVGFMFRQYGLVSAPVVGPEKRLLGMITVDDVVNVIEEEAEDDLMKLGGVQQTDIFASPWRTGAKRLPWLFVNLLTAVAASIVIAQFEDAIAQLVALAVLMPIVASMGGNAGTQTLTVCVRALAVNELATANALKVLGKEALVGAMNGLVFLATGAVLAIVWFGQPMLAAVFGAAMLINLLAAGIVGVGIPLALVRLKLDPAVASGVFLTTVTDIVGFFSFLGLAVLFLL